MSDYSIIEAGQLVEKSTIVSADISTKFQLETLDVEWAALKALRDNGQLVPGQSYRITDYVATTNGDMNSRSANHRFDIIVVADDVDVLNENAHAIQHEGNTYFANNNLAAWKVKYCLDNDTSRFAWAVADNASGVFDGDAPFVGGHGVVYQLVDEFDNDVPYDFKGLQFCRWAISDISSTTLDGSSLDSMKQSFVKDSNGGLYYARQSADITVNGTTFAVASADSVWYYTFGGAEDLSRAGLSNYVYANEIAEYVDNNSAGRLNDIVFLGWGCDSNKFGPDCRASTFTGICQSNTFGQGCHSNMFSGQGCDSNTFSSGCHSNTFDKCCDSNKFGPYCHSNTFGNLCRSNKFGPDCHSNTFGTGCYSNTFGAGCYSNTFGSSCNSNTFGAGCYSNTFGSSCNSNMFDNGCESNKFGPDCYSNTFGIGCIVNTFDSGCYGNTFDSNCFYHTFGANCVSNKFGMICYSNTFGQECSYNMFDGYCESNAFGDYCSNNKLGQSCYYIKFGSESSVKSYCRYIHVSLGNHHLYINPTGTTSPSQYYQNVEIKEGMNNSDTYKTIDDPNVNQTFLTTYKPANSREISIL